MDSSQVAASAGLPESSVLSFAQSLKEKGYVSISSEEEEKVRLTPDGQRFLSEGFPEERVFALAEKGASVSSLSPEEKAVGLAWATRNGWVAVEAGALKAKGRQAGEYCQSLALAKAQSGEKLGTEEQSALLKRKLIAVSASKKIYLEPTAAKPEEPPSEAEINLLTREMLLSGSWEKAALRPYDVSAPPEIPCPAMRHMISRLRRRISSIFVEMGFEEMVGPEVQSSFWNFDALFQPQDHPARELADTFYLKGSSGLPKDDALVQRMKKIHEKCWGGQWLEENASKSVLRTHTTAVSASYLYSYCKGRQPKKYFSVGKVFRNEATDYKHLAEFFQVEGIVAWEGATFRDLLGCLKEFYRKLGFEKIRFQPSYFPYTEPSLEISVYFEKKKQWLELGGAGIFRPEVSIPLCDRYPVLAWGLSLERPLMLLNEMDDIRTFYKSNAGWLRKQKLQ
jgi:phenylalanyl-tRNA synthetase alpha chain